MKIAILFTIFCLAWGSAWFAVKLGVMEAPPLAFAGSRFVCAGLFLLAFVKARGHCIFIIASEDYAKLAMVSFFMITLAYGLIFWGEQYVSAGITAVIALGFIPIIMPVFNMIYMRERLTYGQLLSMFIGFGGLLIIFWPTIVIYNDSLLEFLGMVAIFTSTFFFCWGSVISKNLLSKYSVITLSGFQSLIGGIILLLFAGIFEKSELIHIPQYLTTTVIGAWLFLVFITTIIAFPIYLYLLKEWGASKVSIYAYISPIVAIFLDIILLNDTLFFTEVVGTSLLLSAVWFSIHQPFHLAKKIQFSIKHFEKQGKD